MRRWPCETGHLPQKLAALALLTFPSLRPARVARLLCMMQKKRAFGPQGPLPLLLKEERRSEPYLRLPSFKPRHY